MSAFDGSGTFVISGTGLPVVTNTVISSTVANTLNSDLAIGLSTCITKNGQTTITANIPMAGFKVTGIGSASTTGDALSYGRAATVTTLSATGAATFASTVAVTGTATFSGSASVATNFAVAGIAAVHTTVGGWNTFANFESLAGSSAPGSAISAYQNSSGYAYLARVDQVGALFAAFNYGGGGLVGSISTDGASVAYNTTSDRRLKDNIQDADLASAWECVKALRVRSWDWKLSGAHERFGFVAQEEIEVAPFAVRPGDDHPTEIAEQWGRDESYSATSGTRHGR